MRLLFHINLMHYERYSSIFYCGTLITPYESGQSSRHCYHKDLQKKYYKCFHSTIKHKLRIKVTGYHFIFLTPFLYLMTQKCLLLYLILVSFYRPLFLVNSSANRYIIPHRALAPLFALYWCIWFPRHYFLILTTMYSMW